MTKAADPMLWVHGLWGSGPVWLDRIPRRMRNPCTTTSGGDPDRVGVLLAGLLLAWLVLAERVVAEDGHCARLRARAREDDRGGRRTAHRRFHRAHAVIGH